MLTGKWTYRNFRNDPDLVGGDAEAALALILGEGIFDLDVVDDTTIRGGLGMGLGHALTLSGSIMPGADGAPLRFTMTGQGLPGTATDGWRYDYQGDVAPVWPNAVDQIPSLLGTVIRVNPHGPDAPAGYTASFIAVRQPPPLPRGMRSSTLMVDL